MKNPKEVEMFRDVCRRVQVKHSVQMSAILVSAGEPRAGLKVLVFDQNQIVFTQQDRYVHAHCPVTEVELFVYRKLAKETAFLCLQKLAEQGG